MKRRQLCGLPMAALGPACVKTRKTDGALIHYKRVGHRSPPPRYNERHERLRAAGDQIDCFICSDAVNPAKCPKWSIPLWPCSEAGAMFGSFARRQMN